MRTSTPAAWTPATLTWLRIAATTASTAPREATLIWFMGPARPTIARAWQPMSWMAKFISCRRMPSTSAATAPAARAASCVALLHTR